MTLSRNEIEIRVIGQMRSGNHAIIAWLQSLYEDKSVCFLNNIDHGNYDPFLFCQGMETSGLPYVENLDALRNLKKDILIYSYEDRDSIQEKDINFLPSVFNSEFEANRSYYLGKSSKKIDLIVVRDPFNSLASRLALIRRRGNMGGIDDIFMIKEEWKHVAKYVISLKEKQNPETVVLKYNNWLKDASYRKHIAACLMASKVKRIPKTISKYGGGSSFYQQTEEPIDFLEIINKSHKILSPKRWLNLHFYLRRILDNGSPKVDQFFTRWKILAKDREFLELIADYELLELSEKIFGIIPGTRRLVRDSLNCSYKLGPIKIPSKLKKEPQIPIRQSVHKSVMF